VNTPPPFGDALTMLPGSQSADWPPVADVQTMVPGVRPVPVESHTMAPGATDVGSSDRGPLEPGSAFGARYHVIRLLGIGGMGAVYQAWDAELGVSVAIKVIRPEVMADPGAAAEVERRFKRELLLARAVTHKNVVRIHDLGEINGIKYITMPYVDGADLATVVKRDGGLPVPTVMRIARAIVSGLVEAHKVGVVHRDLKPANIMIGADDEAMIMDFGIARSTGAPVSGPVPGANTIVRNLSRAAVNRNATMLGAVVGTVEYMAPEQAKGIHVDQRADVYAFGLILYDMLVGRPRAEQAGSPIAELQGRMEHAPPSVKSLVPEVPEHVDRIIGRCLEPDAEKRYQTSAELAADLNRLDDEGVPIPEPRRFTPPMIAAGVALVAALVTGTWWFTRTPPLPKKHDPVTVVIADFQNGTGDTAFDHTLEPVLRLALEGADFISAYDRNRIRGSLGVKPPEKLDESTARQFAANQGLGVVLSGSIDRQGTGYEIAVKAVQIATGKVVASAKNRASNKDQVTGAATKLVTTVRKALGDETSDSAQLFAMRGVSATSLEVFHHYAAAMEAQSDGKIEEARLSYQKTVELDPKFGLGYQGLAFMSRNLGKLEDADKYTAEALKHLDGMTDRERFAVRASYYVTTGDFQQCVKEYGELIAQYPADSSGHNNRGVCLSKLRNMREATDEMRQAVQILPKRVSLRANLAMFGNYSGDFQAAEREAKAIQEPTDMAILALVFAYLGQDRVPEATETYHKLETMSARGKSWSAAGLGDLAFYQGRFADAVRTFEQGVTSDLAAKYTDRAARKLTSLAYVEALRGHNAAAIAAADKALLNSKAVPIRFLAARTFVEAGAIAKAQAIAAGLSSELPAEPHAYGKIIEGEIALKSGDPRLAIKILTDANSILDTWLSHFDLGRAYVDLRAYPQADSEFDRCIKRRGEALSLLVDEEPTYGYFPVVYYYQARAREGLKNPKSTDSYREYLKIRGKSTEDPLLPEVRRRAAN
jgi:eukaryotic-like serine/threonine-protein kinase